MTNTETTATTKTTAVAEPGIRVAPEKASSKKAATQKKNVPKTRKGARKSGAKSKPAAKKQTKPAGKKAGQASTPARPGSKKATILELLRRPNGATLTEIAKATQWQNHSIRGFLSGTLRKKISLTVESSRNQAGDRTYRIVK